MSNNLDSKTSLIIAGICAAILFFAVCFHNTDTSEEWNNGTCPECGKEVTRY